MGDRFEEVGCSTWEGAAGKLTAKGGEGRMRGFAREGVRDEFGRSGGRREGVAAGEEHALAEVLRVSGSGDAWVAEHSVGTPTAEQLHSVGVDIGTWESGGTTGPEAAST